MEARNLFASKEVEEEIKKESTKIPVEVPRVSEVSEEEKTPKVSAPTPEQIIAIKVLMQLHRSVIIVVICWP